MTKTQEFWLTPGVMTDLRSQRSWVDQLPDDPRALRSVVARLLLHLHWAPAYEVTVTEQGQIENQLRPAADIVEAIRARGPEAVTELAPADRVVGTCRNFTVLHVALLRAKGIPARARCGHASYFEVGKWVDHWITEWWNEDEDRWVRTDAQIDDFQEPFLAVPVDIDDLAPGVFLAGGECWGRVRDGSIDPATCGIADVWGAWFVRSNVVRDLAALNKVELLPWDDWGLPLSLGQADDAEGDAVIDQLGAVTAKADDVDALRAYYADDRFRVPEVVVSFHQTGPVEVRLDGLLR